MTLQSSDQRMPNFMVGNGLLLFVCQNCILLLIAGNDGFNRLFQIRLRHRVTALADSLQSTFVDDVGQLSAGGTGSHSCDNAVVNVRIRLDLLGMNLEDCFTALQIRQFYRNTAVKPSRPQQRRIQRLRTVRRGENNDAAVGFETIHLGQQLVESLFTLIVAAIVAGNTLSADGIDFIDEDDARRLFLGLLEEVTDLGGPHADEHFNKFRTAHGEERNIRLTGDSLRKHRLAGSRRTYQQNALRHRGTDLLVGTWIMQVLDDFLQRFLRLIFARNIRETDPVL